MPVKTPRPRFFYGWIIVAVCSLTLLVTFGVRLSFSVFFVALIEDFSWPRGSTSLVFSTSMIVFTMFSTPAGMALDRWGARRVFGAGAAVLALGLFLSSRIDSLNQLALAYGVVAGLGITILGLGPQASLIARWFRRRRGLAIGITFAGTGLGTLLLTPGTEYLVSRVGWRGAYLVLAGLVLVIIPVIVSLLRMNPAVMNLLPDGDTVLPQTANPQKSSSQTAEGWQMSEIVRTPAFWLVILAGLGSIGPLRMLTVHQLAVIVDAGFERLFGATVIGLAGAVTAVSFVFFGSLSDRFGRRGAYAIGSFCLLIAVGLLANLNLLPSSNWLVLYALFLGLGEGSRASLITAVVSDMFPGPALGAVNGAVGSAFGFGAAVFPWLAGTLFDQFGSYLLPFTIAAVAIFISTISIWYAPKLMAIQVLQT
jgi:MFS family permease